MIEETIEVLRAAIATNTEVGANIRHNLEPIDMPFKFAVAIDMNLSDLHDRTYDLQRLLKKLEDVAAKARKK